MEHPDKKRVVITGLGVVATNEIGKDKFGDNFSVMSQPSEGE